MSFSLTIPPALRQFSVPTKVHTFTPAVGDSHIRITLNMLNAVYELAGNNVSILIQRSGVHVCSMQWASSGGPTTSPHGVVDPPPIMQCDLTPYIGVALDVFLTIPQAMVVGATLVGA